MANVTQGWQVKKEVSVGDLVAFVSAGIAVAYSWSTLNTRIAVLEQVNITQARIDVRQDEDMNRLKADVKDELRAVNDKLDKLLYRVTAK